MNWTACALAGERRIYMSCFIRASTQQPMASARTSRFLQGRFFHHRPRNGIAGDAFRTAVANFGASERVADHARNLSRAPRSLVLPPQRHANNKKTFNTQAAAARQNSKTVIQPLKDSVNDVDQAMSKQYVTVNKRPEGFAIITIKRDPVNSMDLDMWTQLLDTLTACEKDPEVRGVIFHSGLSRSIFTAGNDLKELYAPSTSRERYIKFWKISNTFLARLSNSPLITIAAIKGACPAGGTCLAMACDYRIITENGNMGLNEVALGITVPAKWIKLMISIIGQGKADKLTMFAKMITADEAMMIGLVDEVVEDEEKLMTRASKTMQKMLMLPDPGRQLTKNVLRGDLAREWADDTWLTQEAEGAWKMLSAPRTVKALEGVFARLSKAKM